MKDVVVEHSLFGLVDNLRLVAPSVVVQPMYSGFFAEFYSEAMGYQQFDVSWYRSHGGRLDADVLDLCGGDGRLGKGVREGGGKVVVVDNAPDMLRQSGLSSSDDVELIESDIFEFEIGRTFERVVCGGLAFSMFEAKERSRVLEVAAAHLEPQGRLLLDYLVLTDGEVVSTQYFALPLFGSETGYVLVGVCRDPVAKVQRTNFFAELDDRGRLPRRLASGHELALLTAREFDNEIRAAGLDIVAEFDYWPPVLPGSAAWPIRFVSAVRRI